MLVNSSESSLSWPGKNNVLYVTPESEYPIKPDAPLTSTEVWLTGLGFNSDRGEVKFEYNMVNSFPDCVTVLREAKALGAQDKVYQLEWDEYPGATGYIVNQWSINQETGESLELAPVTVSTNWYRSAKLPSRVWADAKYRASITVIDHLPSTRTSNEIEFVLADLDWTGVDNVDIDEDAPIFGGVGCIYAPDGAEVYTLSGVRVGVTDLSAGMYVVRTPKKAVKVIVK